MEEAAEYQQMSDLQAHSYAMRLPIQQVVRELVRLLGATTVAAIGGVTETRAVAQWTKDREPQRPHVLRFALQLACMIDAATGDYHVVRAWFQGSNPLLGDAVPATLLRDEPLAEIQTKLVLAARDFAI